MRSELSKLSVPGFRFTLQKTGCVNVNSESSDNISSCPKFLSFLILLRFPSFPIFPSFLTFPSFSSFLILSFCKWGVFASFYPNRGFRVFRTFVLSLPPLIDRIQGIGAWYFHRVSEQSRLSFYKVSEAVENLAEKDKCKFALDNF